MKTVTTPPTASDDYTVSNQQLVSRIGVTPQTMCAYIRSGFITRGRRRPGARGVFYTPAQANKLIKLIGSNAEPFKAE